MTDRLQRNRRDDRERVVVTGVGMVSALGLDANTSWQRMVAGCSGTRLIEVREVKGLECASAAVVDWQPGDHMDRRDARKTSRATQFAWKAAREALGQADLDPGDVEAGRLGIEIGDAFGGWDLIEDQTRVLYSKGFRRINPVLSLAALISGTPTFIGMRLGVTGIANSPVAACATGVGAVGEAARRILYGEADVMLAGGSDGYVTPMTVSMFGRLGAMSFEVDNPAAACAPFAGNRTGMVIGEGAGVLVLEGFAHARARGARILAEFGGYSLRLDPSDFANPDPEGRVPSRVMADAIADSGLHPVDIDWVVAHGTATKANDTMETRAIHSALGEHAPDCPVTGLKGMLGHAMGGAGAHSIVAAVKAMHDGHIPPTINYREPDPKCDLDYVPNQARPHAVDAALVNGFGMGGQSASLVLLRHNG
ncbi:MAG: beta-ketoacyl-[acyl-carrier-protein] synthase family protein [Caldilineaceae bacterium SB0664_bin_22]|nr:beta-ketoacyl-[acyl-carrier-protein] synthase family protein [Caldilineaceae bacterium SB0664_bin_22]